MGDTHLGRRNPAEPVPVDRATMERRMHIQHETSWPAIDLAELRFGLAFGASAEELAEFLSRDVDDVRHQVDVEEKRGGLQVLDEVSGLPGVYDTLRDRPRS
jgi:hypothetical protein